MNFGEGYPRSVHHGAVKYLPTRHAMTNDRDRFVGQCSSTEKVRIWELRKFGEIGNGRERAVYLAAHPTDRKWVISLVINGISGGHVHL